MIAVPDSGHSGDRDDKSPNERGEERQGSTPDSSKAIEQDLTKQVNDSENHSESPDRAWHTMAGTWVFGSLLFIFFVLVFTIGPDKLPEFKQRMLGISSPLLAGFFTFFLTGEIKLRFPEMEGFIGEKSRATGGIGIFILVLLWWSSPLAPIGLAEAVDSIKTDTLAIRSDTKEIKEGVGELGRLGDRSRSANTG